MRAWRLLRLPLAPLATRTVEEEEEEGADQQECRAAYADAHAEGHGAAAA